MSRVLIVDDEEDVRYLLSAALDGSFDIQFARDGREAVAAMEEKLPDALLLDVNLPSMSGMDVLEAVHRRDPLLPVVIMTASGTLDSAVQALRLGAYDYILKPFDDLDMVRVALQRALETRALRVENSRLLEDVRSANEFKSQLLRTVSHDFKNLLTVVVGYTRLTQMAPDQSAEFLDHITTTTRLMALMAEDLGTYSQIDTGVLKLQHEDVSLRACIADSVKAVMVNPNVHRVSPPDSELHVWADRYRTTQIFTNLIGNAIKYSPRGGDIRISAEAMGDLTRISVADNGLGIPESEKGKLFRPFFRLERDKTQGTPGTGLGLTIVKNLVELHGGTIWAESQEGVGTTFHFTLPSVGQHVEK